MAEAFQPKERSEAAPKQELLVSHTAPVIVEQKIRISLTRNGAAREALRQTAHPAVPRGQGLRYRNLAY